MDPVQIPAVFMAELQRNMYERRWCLESASHCLVFVTIYSTYMYMFQCFYKELSESLFLVCLCAGILTCLIFCYCRIKFVKWYKRRQNEIGGRHETHGQQTVITSEHIIPEESTASTRIKTETGGHDKEIKKYPFSSSESGLTPISNSTFIKFPEPLVPQQCHRDATQITREVSGTKLKWIPSNLILEANNVAGIQSAAVATFDPLQCKQSEGNSQSVEEHKEIELVSPNAKFVLNKLQLIKYIEGLTNEIKLLNSSLKEESSEIVVLKVKSLAKNIEKLKDTINQLKTYQVTDVERVKPVELNQQEIFSFDTYSRTSSESSDSTYKLLENNSKCSKFRLLAKSRTQSAKSVHRSAAHHQSVSLWKRLKDNVKFHHSLPRLNASRNAFRKLQED